MIYLSPCSYPILSGKTEERVRTLSLIQLSRVRYESLSQLDGRAYFDTEC